MRIERDGLLTRSLVILTAILAMVAVVSRMMQRTEPSHQFAQAIVHGVATANMVTEDDWNDQNLTDDEQEAGQVWAEHHPFAGSAACPYYSPAFRRGCIDRMSDAGAP